MGRSVGFGVYRGRVRVWCVTSRGWVDWPIRFGGVVLYEAPERIGKTLRRKVEVVFRFLDRYQGQVEGEVYHALYSKDGRLGGGK